MENEHCSSSQDIVEEEILHLFSYSKKNGNMFSESVFKEIVHRQTNSKRGGSYAGHTPDLTVCAHKTELTLEGVSNMPKQLNRLGY